MGIIEKISDKLGGNKSTATNDVDNSSNVHSLSTHPTTDSSNLHNPSNSASGHSTSGIPGGTAVGEGSHLASHNQKHDGPTGTHSAQHSSTTSALPHGSHGTSNTTQIPGTSSTTGHQTSGIVGGSSVGQDSHHAGLGQQHSVPGAFPTEHSSRTSSLPQGSHATSTHTESHIPGVSTTGHSHQSNVLPGQHSSNSGSHIPGSTTTAHDGSILPGHSSSNTTTNLPGSSGHGRDNIIGSHSSNTTSGTELTGSHNANTTTGLRNETALPHGTQHTSTSHHTGTGENLYDDSTSTHNKQSGGGLSGLIKKIPGIGNKDHDKHAHDSTTHGSIHDPESDVGGHHVASGPGHNTLLSNTAQNTPSQPFDPYSSEGQRTALNASNDPTHVTDTEHQHRKSSIKPVSGPHATLENHSAIPTAGGVKVGDGPFEQDRSYHPTAKTAHITSAASGNSNQTTHGHHGQTGPDNRGMMDKAKDTLSSKRTNHPDDPITGTNFDQKNTGGLTGSNQTQGLPGPSSRSGLTGGSHTQSSHSGLGSSNVHQSGDGSHSGFSSGTHGQTQRSGLGSSSVHQGGLTGAQHSGLSSGNHTQTQHSGLGNLTSGTSADQPPAHDQSFAEHHAPGVGTTTGNFGQRGTANPLSSGGHYPSSNIPTTQNHHNSSGNPLTAHNASGNPLTSANHTQQ